MPLAAPDVERALRSALAAVSIDVRPTLGPPWPAVALYRVGGDRAVVADTALVQVDAAADAGGSKAGTLTLLERVIAAVRDLPGTTLEGVTVASVRVDGGPQYLPDPLTGAPRYVATLRVVSRAARAGAA